MNACESSPARRPHSTQFSSFTCDLAGSERKPTSLKCRSTSVLDNWGCQSVNFSCSDVNTLKHTCRAWFAADVWLNADTDWRVSIWAEASTWNNCKRRHTWRVMQQVGQQVALLSWRKTWTQAAGGALSSLFTANKSSSFRCSQTSNCCYIFFVFITLMPQVSSSISIVYRDKFWRTDWHK